MPISSTFVVVATIVSATIHGAITGGAEGSIQALVMSLTSMALSNAIGGVFNGWNPVNELTNLQDFNFTEIARAFAHGITQGGLSELAGGEFGSGFAGAFAGSIVGSLQGAGVGRKFFGLPRVDTHKIVHRTVAAAVVGGTISKIGGGKFANGAMTAAMVHLFNSEGIIQLLDPGLPGGTEPKSDFELIQESIAEMNERWEYSRAEQEYKRRQLEVDIGKIRTEAGAEVAALPRLSEDPSRIDRILRSSHVEAIFRRMSNRIKMRENLYHGRRILENLPYTGNSVRSYQWHDTQLGPDDRMQEELRGIRIKNR